MARRKSSTPVSIPTTFVGTFYDVEKGVYVATRKDGTLTVGRMNERGLNLVVGAVTPSAGGAILVEA